MNKRTPESAFRAMQKYEESMRALLAEYGENIIEVPAERRWDYAIPSNYTNYHDGFIVQDELPYRGMPMIRYGGKVLYLRYAVPWIWLDPGEDEKLLLFDRDGKKYTFLVREQADKSQPNPSYFSFVLNVKKYTSELFYFEIEKISELC